MAVDAFGNIVPDTVPGTGPLPPLLSVGTTGESKIDPTLRPYLERGLQRAEQLFFGAQPSLFPGQMYVSPSEQTLTALQQQEALARQQSPVLSAAQQAFLSGIGAQSSALPMYQNIYGAAGTRPGVPTFERAAAGEFINPALAGIQQVAGGGFLQGSPYQQAMISAATRPLVQQYAEQVVPGIASGFSRAGRYGSGAMERAQGQAAESFARGLGDITTGIVSQDYARERAFQEAARQQLAQIGQQDVATRLAGAGALEQAQQAALGTQLQATSGLATTQAQDIGRQLAAAQAAPSFFQMGFLPSQTLAQVGAAREAIAAQPLQEQMQRYQYSQMQPYESLRGYLSSVYGTPMGSSQYAQPQQAQTNRFGQALGGGILGSQLGGLFGGYGGFSGSQIGAGLGGLAGLLF